MADSIDKYGWEENYGWTNAIEYSKYKTMESLAKMLKKYHENLEKINDITIDTDCDLHELTNICFGYDSAFSRDEELFMEWQLSSQDLQERISDIQSNLDHFTDIYNERVSEFEQVIELFDDPKDKLFQKKAYKVFLKAFSHAQANIEDILDNYRDLAEDDDE